MLLHSFDSACLVSTALWGCTCWVICLQCFTALPFQALSAACLHCLHGFANQWKRHSVTFGTKSIHQCACWDIDSSLFLFSSLLQSVRMTSLQCISAISLFPVHEVELPTRFLLEDGFPLYSSNSAVYAVNLISWLNDGSRLSVMFLKVQHFFWPSAGFALPGPSVARAGSSSGWQEKTREKRGRSGQSRVVSYTVQHGVDIQ